MRALEKNFYNTLSDLFWKAYGLKSEGILSRASNRIKTPVLLSVICSLPRGANTNPIRRVRPGDGWRWKTTSDQNGDCTITESEERWENSRRYAEFS